MSQDMCKVMRLGNKEKHPFCDKGVAMTIGGYTDIQQVWGRGDEDERKKQAPPTGLVSIEEAGGMVKGSPVAGTPQTGLLLRTGKQKNTIQE